MHVVASTPASDGAASSSAEAVEATGTPAGNQAQSPDKKAVAADDPEIELDADLKLKRSELRDIAKKRKDFDRAAHERMQQAAQLRKEAAAEKQAAEQILAEMGADVKAAIRKAGKDPIKVAEEILSEALKEYSLSPEERRQKELESENSRLQKEIERRQKEEKEQQEKAEVSKWEQQFDVAFSSAIKTVGLPKTPRTVARMAEKVDAYWSSGLQVPLEEVAAEIKQELIDERRQLLQAVSEDQEDDFFDSLELERARRLIMKKAGLQEAKQPQQPQATRSRAPVSKALTRAEMEARIAKRIGA